LAYNSFIRLGFRNWSKILAIEVLFLLVNCLLPDAADFLTIGVRPNGWIIAIIEKHFILQIKAGNEYVKYGPENKRSKH
jgi:hypothetical protein